MFWLRNKKINIRYALLSGGLFQMIEKSEHKQVCYQGQCECKGRQLFPRTCGSVINDETVSCSVPLAFVSLL